MLDRAAPWHTTVLPLPGGGWQGSLDQYPLPLARQAAGLLGWTGSQSVKKLRVPGLAGRLAFSAALQLDLVF